MTPRATPVRPPSTPRRTTNDPVRRLLMQPTLAITTVLLGAGLTVGVSAQSVLWETAGPQFDYGAATTSVGDIDGDGVPDVVVGTPSINTIEWLSGADGAVIRSQTGQDASRFGAALAGVGDVNGDGVPDLAVGAPRAEALNGESGGGALFVLSGSDGSTIWSDQGSELFDAMGSAVVALGDINLDGRGDVAYAADLFPSTQICKVAAGHNGTPLAFVLNVQLDLPFSDDLAGGADVDGDGIPDLAVAGRSPTALTTLDVYSGASLAAGLPDRLFQVEAPSGGFRTDFCDVDGDGVAEVLLGDPSEYPNGVQGRVLVLDAEGKVLDEWNGKPGQRLFGIGVRTLGDADGDGRDDVAVRAYPIDGMPSDEAHASMVSGQSGQLIADSRGGFPYVMTRVGDLDGDGRDDLLATWNPITSGATSTPVVRATSSRQGSITSVGAPCQPVGTPPLQLFVYGEASAGGSLNLLATGATPGAVAWLGFGLPTPAITLPSGCDVLVAPLLALVPVTLDIDVAGVGFGAGLLLDVPPTLSPVTLGVQAFAQSGGTIALSDAVVVELVD